MNKLYKYAASFILLIFASCSLSVYANNEPIARIYEETSNVVISGALDSNQSGTEVVLLLIEKTANLNNLLNSQIGYMNQKKVEQDGSYLFKFKFTGNIDNYQVMVNQAGVNITKSVSRAVATDDFLKVTLDLTEGASLAKSIVNINNLYGRESLSYKMMLVFYSKTGEMIDVKTVDKKSIQIDTTADELSGNIPNGTEKIKAFIWDSSEKIIPLCEPVTRKCKTTLRVLAIGNSFSADAVRYVHDIAAADNVNLTIANLYIGGCNLYTHWYNASNNLKLYDYLINGSSSGQKKSIKEALELEDWDYVTLQQESGTSGVEATYYPYIENLAKYVKNIEPQTELMIHQTWAYEEGSTHEAFPTYSSNQQIMFNSLKSAYDNAARKVGLLTLDNGSDISLNKASLTIIPSGQAFQNARANLMFDAIYNDGKLVRLNRDGYHASLTHGRYLLGAVWYEMLTGKDIEQNTYKPVGVSDEELIVLKQAAHKAVVEYRK